MEVNGSKVMAKKQTIGQMVRGALRELSESLLELMTFKDFRLTDDEVSDEWAKEMKYGMTPVKPKRTRTKKGRYRADIKETKDWNEAWVGGKSPKKKKKTLS